MLTERMRKMRHSEGKPTHTGCIQELLAPEQLELNLPRDPGRNHDIWTSAELYPSRMGSWAFILDSCAPLIEDSSWKFQHSPPFRMSYALTRRKPGGRTADRHQRGPLGSHCEYPAVHHCTEVRGAEGLGRTHKTSETGLISGPSPHFRSMFINNSEPRKQAYPIWK